MSTERASDDTEGRLDDVEHTVDDLKKAFHEHCAQAKDKKIRDYTETAAVAARQYAEWALLQAEWCAHLQAEMERVKEVVSLAGYAMTNFQSEPGPPPPPPPPVPLEDEANE